MQIDKGMILDFLRSQGQHDKASEADGQLPASVDTDRDAGLLDQLDINVPELLAKLQGGQLGDIAGSVGDLFKH
jgi:hypothetical protein